MTGPSPRPPGLLTLTTDFGLEGPYVAAMKGVILGLARGATLVNVTHAIPPQDVNAGAYVLAEASSPFPPGTVHLAVVNPGVGTGRRLVAVEARGQWFVLPDNGLISGVLEDHRPTCVREIRNPKLWRPSISSTFHGRDILGPVAAHLVLGRDPVEIGPTIEGLVLRGGVGPVAEGGVLVGSVVYVDPFGNLITDLRGDRLGEARPDSWSVEVGGQRFESIRTYGERPAGSVVALVGSSGRIEVAVVGGHAARRLGAGPGTPIRLRIGGEAS